MAHVSNKNDQGLQALVAKAAHGDETAFGQIYELYYQKVYRFVFYRTNHAETSEDLVAETFIRVWDKIGKIKDIEAFNGWIYQIARNLVIDYYRSRKPTLDLTFFENVIEYEENLLDKTDLLFQQKRFLEELNKLSPDAQLVIKLKFLDELDNSEIAAILNKTEGAVRVIQHRAINELKELINGHDE